MRCADFGIIGGGIVGLATAYKLRARFPGATVALWEKEAGVARHQSGRNSGVVHSGIYYPSDSLKADLSRRGRAMLMEFCAQNGLPSKRVGKLIVAQVPDQVEYIVQMLQGSINKGINAQILNENELGKFAPLVAGVGALNVPDVSIVDFRAVAECLAHILEESGVDVYRATKVSSVRRDALQTQVNTDVGAWQVGTVINCAGLHSDTVQRMLGLESDYRIIPFRGQYFEVLGPVRESGLGLVYPLPDPRFPFLGVHLTPCLDGRMLAGPNAVLSLGRESYEGFRAEFGDLFKTLSYAGFWRLVRQHWRVASRQYLLQWSRRRFLRAVRELCPSVREEDLRPGPCGIRAQVVDRQGALVQDFVLEKSPGVISVLNAPSPAATSAFAIGEKIAAQI